MTTSVSAGIKGAFGSLLKRASLSPPSNDENANPDDARSKKKLKVELDRERAFLNSSLKELIDVKARVSKLEISAATAFGEIKDLVLEKTAAQLDAQRLANQVNGLEGSLRAQALAHATLEETVLELRAQRNIFCDAMLDSTPLENQTDESPAAGEPADASSSGNSWTSSDEDGSDESCDSANEDETVILPRVALALVSNPEQIKDDAAVAVAVSDVVDNESVADHAGDDDDVEGAESDKDQSGPAAAEDQAHSDEAEAEAKQSITPAPEDEDSDEVSDQAQSDRDETAEAEAADTADIAEA